MVLRIRVLEMDCGHCVNAIGIGVGEAETFGGWNNFDNFWESILAVT
jgi:hypothetical protein